MTRAAYRKRVRERIKKKAVNTTKKLHVMTKRDKPLTSEYELKKTRQEINATNRRRAKDMERRVARYLKGKRVPSSGAIAGMKGDCTIPLESGGFYIVECKMTAHERNDVPMMVMSLQWFDKLIKDAQSMNAKFGVLVIHYHRKKQDYVFVPIFAMRYMMRFSVHRFVLDTVITSVVPHDISTLNERKRSTYSLNQLVLESQFITVFGYKVTAFNFPSGLWYCFALEQCRDLMEGV